mmetsp:Transcript_10353/g.16775  ORF Transcript_10353/g.16775 Transcript_10353/m.16775 type:complete len:183 (+) Transcript_10353:116-664(+)
MKNRASHSNESKAATRLKFTRNYALEEESSNTVSTNKVSPPVGYFAGDFRNTGDDSNVRRIHMDEKIKRSAMATASSPMKQILMTGVMMFMSGNTLQIFSIMMLGMAMWTPIRGLLETGKVFERYEDRGVDLVMPKLIYIALNLGGFALVCWKLRWYRFRWMFNQQEIRSSYLLTTVHIAHH